MASVVKALNVPDLDRREVLRYLGYRGQEMTSELEARLDKMIAAGLAIARPHACVRAFEVGARTVRADGVPVLELDACALRLEGASIAKHLSGAVSVGVMAVTLGAGIDQELRRLSLVDPLAHVMFDAVATALIERAADACEALLVEDAASRGLFTTWRFSPGYGDFPLDCQSTLLSTLDATRRLGITLTPSLLMIPTKSVTAVVGYFESPQEKARPGCESCNLREFCTIEGTACRGAHAPSV